MGQGAEAAPEQLATTFSSSRSLLLAEDVHKRYGGVHALRGARLEVARGEIHGLVGENGSGKSTLLKILSGQVAPDRATLTIDSQPLTFRDPTHALASGIAAVTQETTLVPELTVAENILLGRRMVRRWHGIDWGSTRRRAREALEQLKLDIDPSAVVGRLRPDEQQMIEIARAISLDARVLILDEPTSSLTDDELEALFDVMRRLRARGLATIFVSHRMNEVLTIPDRVTVLRDGVTVGGGPTSAFDRDRMIELMVGHAPEEHAHPGSAHLRERPALCIRDISVPDRVRGVSLDVAPGEIVGLAGLVGAGRSELLAALFGLEPEATGAIELGGQPVRCRDPRDAIGKGLAYLPADRKRHGLVLQMTVGENLMMAKVARRARILRPRRASETREVARMLESFRIVAAGPGVAAQTLSGGNQQKVVLAKWLSLSPRALLLDEPTRGVDVGAKTEIYRLLDAARAQNMAILVSSSEVGELMQLCDRIVVMFRGEVAATLPRDQSNEARIAHYGMGHA